MTSKSPLEWAKGPASPWSVGSDEAYITRSVRIDDPTGVGEARRTASRLIDACKFDESVRGRLEIVVTELARNALIHGKGGELLIRPWSVDGAGGVDVVALDKGPGIKSISDSMRDGFSTSGTSGTGLGAVSRMGSAFDVYSKAGSGAAVFVEISAKDKSATRPGVTCVSKPGEDVPGDGWYFYPTPTGVTILVVDGLGHGYGAQEAANQAMHIVAEHRGDSLDRIVNRMHQSMAKTRGAALALVRIDRSTKKVHYMGVGNISGVICSPSGVQRMVSHNGTVGHIMPRAQEFQYTWPAGATLVMWSDGLATNIDPTHYNGLLTKHPTLVSAVLYRDHTRGRDDSTALVYRDAEAA